MQFLGRDSGMAPAQSAGKGKPISSQWGRRPCPVHLLPDCLGTSPLPLLSPTHFAVPQPHQPHGFPPVSHTCESRVLCHFRTRPPPDFLPDHLCLPLAPSSSVALPGLGADMPHALASFRLLPKGHLVREAFLQYPILTSLAPLGFPTLKVTL